jgi:hypothetical protein
MTHSTVATERENAGSVSVVYHVIDITSLDSGGTEQYDAEAEVGLSDAGRFGLDVRAKEDPTVAVSYDHLNDELNVVNVADGTNVANNTDVGEVMLEVVGV